MFTVINIYSVRKNYILKADFSPLLLAQIGVRILKKDLMDWKRSGLMDLKKDENLENIYLAHIHISAEDT